MPTLYVVGVEAGKSTITETRELSIAAGGFEALRVDDAIPAIPDTGTGVLLEAMSPVGGSVHNIWVFEPGLYSDMHRTDTIDIDVVLSGSLELEVETQTVVLEQGDMALISGANHAWRSGPEGAVVLFTLLAGSPRPADVQTPRAGPGEIMHQA